MVTGATGYIGGRLVPELLDAGFRVRCMSRSVERLRDYPWASRVERVEADAKDPEASRRALDGIEVAYYLIHALGAAAVSRRPTDAQPETSPPPRPLRMSGALSTWAA